MRFELILNVEDALGKKSILATRIQEGESFEFFQRDDSRECFIVERSTGYVFVQLLGSSWKIAKVEERFERGEV